MTKFLGVDFVGEGKSLYLQWQSLLRVIFYKTISAMAGKDKKALLGQKLSSANITDERSAFLSTAVQMYNAEIARSSTLRWKTEIHNSVPADRTTLAFFEQARLRLLYCEENPGIEHYFRLGSKHFNALLSPVVSDQDRLSSYNSRRCSDFRYYGYESPQLDNTYAADVLLWKYCMAKSRNEAERVVLAFDHVFGAYRGSSFYNSDGVYPDIRPDVTLTKIPQWVLERDYSDVDISTLGKEPEPEPETSAPDSDSKDGSSDLNDRGFGSAPVDPEDSKTDMDRGFADGSDSDSEAGEGSDQVSGNSDVGRASDEETGESSDSSLGSDQASGDGESLGAGGSGLTEESQHQREMDEVKLVRDIQDSLASDFEMEAMDDFSNTSVHGSIYAKERPAKPHAAVVDQIRTAMSEVQADVEPGWNRAQSGSRFDLSRYLTDPSDSEIWRSWDSGREEDVSCDVIVCVDVSSSMGGSVGQLSTATQTIKTALEGFPFVNLKIFSFSTEVVTLHDSARGIELQPFQLHANGGTDFLQLAGMCNVYFQISPSKYKMLFVLSDGAFNDPAEISSWDVLNTIRQYATVSYFFYSQAQYKSTALTHPLNLARNTVDFSSEISNMDDFSDHIVKTVIHSLENVVEKGV